MGLPEPVAVVAHDAGAANLILAWIGATPAAAIRPFMVGPAAKLWRARFPGRPLAADIGDALAGAASLLSGSGWATDAEHDARRAARARGVPSVAVLDHWVNYRERFVRDGREVLPDRIWVADDEAFSRARALFPDVTVERHDNLYLTEQAAGAGPPPADGDLLFLSEPVRSDWGQGRPGEFQALDFLVEHAPAAGVPPALPLRVRPHPSDPPGKYDRWLADQPFASLDRSNDVAAALAGARFVAGMNSAALAIALAAGRTTICALPPAAPPCVLPLSGLVHLRALAS